MLAVFYAYIQRVTGDHDVAIATLFANRSREQVRRTVGFLVNLVVMRGVLPVAGNFHDALEVARNVVGGAFAHQVLDRLGGDAPVDRTRYGPAGRGDPRRPVVFRAAQFPARVQQLAATGRGSVVELVDGAHLRRGQAEVRRG